MALLVVLILAVICGFFGGSASKAKGLDTSSWFFACLLTGPLGLIALAAMPDLKLRTYMRFLAESKGYEEKNFDDQGKAVPRGASQQEAFDNLVSLYRDAGGQGEPDLASSSLIGSTALIKDKQGRYLIEFGAKNGEWNIQKFYR